MQQGKVVGDIILFPGHENYCKECIYYEEKFEKCKNQNYKENIYKVCCVWKRCKYKRKRLQQDKI